ncbi:MAG: winged helix-turn-helix transcriptional regulator [Asgard group archaeon]|nr:winged helix-turn-helix transcriptional regulator [Asgard group archaeon]
MKPVRFLIPKKERPGEESFDLFELLLDPIRSKIIFEVILRNEVTADYLIEVTDKSRSTISHHLKKLVENRILEVYMNPTGKTKYYRMNQDLSDLEYTFNEEEFSQSTIEDKSLYVLNFYQVFAIFNNIYANIFSDQIKLFQKYFPFEEVTRKNGRFQFRIKNKEIEIPYFTAIIIDEERANFLKNKFREVMKEYQKEFGEEPENMISLDAKPRYFAKWLISPYYDDQYFES